MMDLVYWSRAFRAEREREAARHQRASHARRVLRAPDPPLRRDALRSLLPPAGPGCIPLADCCGIFGVGA